MYEKIKAFCDSHDITIAQFESICGLKENYVYKLQSNIRCPNARFVNRMAEVMGITPKELMGETDE